MIIREVKQSDLKKIADIYESGHDEVSKDPTFGDYLRLKRPDANRKKAWAKETLWKIKEGHMLFFLGEEKGKITGFCFITKKDIPDSEMSHIGVLGVRVVKEFRGQHIGTKLITHALKKAKGKFYRIEAYIMSTNKTSKHIFGKLGFKRWGTAPGYVKRGKKYIDLEYASIRL